jgi:hypothetical protein
MPQTDKSTNADYRHLPSALSSEYGATGVVDRSIQFHNAVKSDGAPRLEHLILLEGDVVSHVVVE